ncbi:MAG: alpha/beta hydrolase [bacterium]|nr:alpha/beta hydrolase [bacterium]
MKYVIFHGAFGNKDGNWFPYIKAELLKLNQEVILEQYPVENWDEVIKTEPSFIPKNQTLDNWIKKFEKDILPYINKDDKLCFVGHSLGPVFILHLIQKFNIQLDSAIFVEPFLLSLNNKEAWMFDVVNNSFYKHNFNYELLQKLIPTSYVVYSDNDLVPTTISLDFAHKMQSSTILLKGAKHINAPFFTKLPIVLELCKSRIEASLYDH